MLFGGLAVYSQPRDGVPFRVLRWTAPALLLAGCVAFGGLAYVLDSDSRHRRAAGSPSQRSPWAYRS